MLKANVMIREDQEEKLKALSLETGLDHDELIRLGVDMVIAQKQGKNADWRVALDGIFGIWEDHDQIDRLLQSEHDQLKRRHAKLHIDQA